MLKSKAIKNYKKDFTILKNSKIVYLDSAATTQKPKCVIDAVSNFYRKNNANIHRGAYNLSIKASQMVDEARHNMARFINAKFDEEIIFAKNATECLNLLAYSFGLENLQQDDEVVLSIMEHHSMIVPWQKITAQKNAKLKYLYLNNDYQIDEAEIDSKITNKTKIVGISTVSNVLGTINDYKKIIKKAHSVGAVVILDASQSIAHMSLDVQNLDADFIVFSGHKMYAPLGVGVLYGKKELLQKMPPFVMGGDMIEYVYEDHTTLAPLPNKFEAGTIDASSIIGLSSAVDYINNIGYNNIEKHEKEICMYAIQKLKELSFVKLYITSNLKNHSGVISFNIENVHPHDVASILDAENICIRAGNHCAQPLLRYLGINSTCRISLGIYTTKKDIDLLVKALKKVEKIFNF